MDQLLTNLVMPFIVGVTSYLLFTKRDEWKKFRNESVLGVVVLQALIEEIKEGLQIFENSKGKNVSILLTPKASWYGMETIPNDVLLRIVAISKNIKHEPGKFHPSEVRIHCKNYFEHMLTNWEIANKKQALFTGPVDFRKYPELRDGCWKC